MNELSFGVPVPQRMRLLPVYKGFPVPFFAAVLDGVPDFRIADSSKKSLCAIKRLCWICGQKIRYPEKFCFVGGPICVRHRLFSDGPMHLECAVFALKVCPYLLHDDAKRADFEKLRDKLKKHSGRIVEEPGHAESHPDWFYLCHAPSYDYAFVPEVGYKLFKPEAFNQIDKWRNGKMNKSSISDNEIV
jgi:hypothetical protein